ncbi:diacylglycerol acyltransferase [Auriculariales sp. MPI-PUGE-AT-0066]|nr:diacylglycerol acyltransferase [Auriculariales sp. MPI-PUGE-AT-0066]
MSQATATASAQTRPSGPERPSFRLSPLRSFKPLADIEFVPSNVPRHRRLQTFSVAMWSLLIPICLILFNILCSIPALWPFIALYCVFIAFDRAPEHGGRSSRWVRGMIVWKYFAQYYPAEVDLPADRPYLFGYHPHATFATEGTGFSKAFPGIRPHLLTLASNFNIPIYREIMMMMGICSVSKRSCINILREGNGSSITIVIGGAAESLAARPGTADLTLRKRLGFIKIAIQQGADLVPIYEQVDNEKGTKVYEVQRKFQSMFGFTMPLFHGRGLLNYNFGLMPHRRSIVTVVGRPVSVTQHDRPTIQMVEEVQARYIEELMRIWDTYKDSYARHRKQELRIIE